MSERESIDLRAAINAISDVVQNRPRPIRNFDQIYMKAGDMVLQSELVARWAKGKRLAFIGDGDAISVCVAYLHNREIISEGPAQITVYDFDERICHAVTRFAERERLTTLRAELYNCVDPFPAVATHDLFYTNPPWGQSNQGESIKAFAQRGMEAVGYSGGGIIVMAHDDSLSWTGDVLMAVQGFALESRYYVQRMMPSLHQYHLDDNPDLRSCNLILAPASRTVDKALQSLPLGPEQLKNFYGRGLPLKVHYVRDRRSSEFGSASDDEFELEVWKERL